MSNAFSIDSIIDDDFGGVELNSEQNDSVKWKELKAGVQHYDAFYKRSIWDEIYSIPEMKFPLRRHDMYIISTYKEALQISHRHPISMKWRDPLREAGNPYVLTTQTSKKDFMIHRHRYSCACSKECKVQAKIEYFHKSLYHIYINDAEHPSGFEPTVEEFPLDPRVLKIIENCAPNPADYPPKKVQQKITEKREKLGYPPEHGGFNISKDKIRNKLKYIRRKLAMTQVTMEQILEFVDNGAADLQVVSPADWNQRVDNMCIILYRMPFLQDSK